MGWRSGRLLGWVVRWGLLSVLRAEASGGGLGCVEQRAGWERNGREGQMA